MASKFQRRQGWWVKFRHPSTGHIIRESLQTTDEARAELLRRRLDLEVALREPRFQLLDIPQPIQEALGMSHAMVHSDECGKSSTVTQSVSSTPHTLPIQRTTVDAAVSAYLRFIKTENAPLHVANKVSILRRFLGADRVVSAGGPARSKRQRLENGDFVPEPAPFFTGTYLDEIRPALVQDFFEGLGVSKKTVRHYREAFHHFFEFCLKFDLYVPTNWHRPNPIAALPSYVSRNRHIVFLSLSDVCEQLEKLRGSPAMQIAVQIMMHAGLRRSETVWLTKESVAPDCSYLSVRYRRDEDADIEGSLKTGERTVTILPPLRTALLRYLPSLNSRWLIPTSKGERWRPDQFGKQLRALNQSSGLKWTCLSDRHTYATQRAAEGWSLFRIAKEMGNSAAVVEEYYAGFLRPEGLIEASPTILS